MPVKKAAARPKAKKGGGAFSIEEAWPEITRETRLLSDIHPYPNNPRTHPPAQIALLGELIKKYGPDQDIVIDGDDDMILKGHGRRLAALSIGLREFPVTVRRGLSHADKTAMRIADNAVSLLSGWDQELIRGEIALLKTSGYDLPLLGFGDAQLVQFTTTPGPPAQFPAVDENIPTSYCCPRCGFSWSGAAKPEAEKSNGKDQVRVRVPKNTNPVRPKRPSSKVSSESSLAGKAEARQSATRKPKSPNRSGPSQAST